MKYKNVVLIPARGGSKSIKLKNIKELAGQPLIYWTIDAAVNCERVDKVFVSTDSEIIKEACEKYDKVNCEKLEVIDRSAECSTDEASTESVMLDFTKKVNYENIILMQCTSPLVTTDDINGCLDIFKDYDSVMSSVIQKRFYWTKNDDGSIKELNYDVTKRPRRQEWDGLYAENGAIFIISRDMFLKSKCRLAGKIGTYAMPEDTYYEIDEELDWDIIEMLIGRRKKNGDRDE